MWLKTSLRAQLGLLVANLIWAADYPFYKILMPHYVSPLGLATFALLVAAAIALLTLLWGRIERLQPGDFWRMCIAALLLGIAKKLLLMAGVQHSNPIEASIIATVGPLLVLVISVWFGIDRFTPLKVVGLILGMSGAVLAILSGAQVPGAKPQLVGNLLVFASVSASSFSMVWLKGLIMRYRPITILRWYYPIAAVMLLPFGWEALGQIAFAQFTPQVWGAFLFATLLPTFGPNFLLIYSLHYVKPTISSVYFYLQPVGAAALSMMMHVDRPSGEEALASLIVFAGVFLVVRSYRRAHTSPLHSMN